MPWSGCRRWVMAGSAVAAPRTAAGSVNREGRALRRRRTLEPEAAAVVLDDLAADGQAEAGAARRVGEGVAGLGEGLEDLGLIVRGDADAGVDDRDLDAAVGGRRGLDR